MLTTPFIYTDDYVASYISEGLYVYLVQNIAKLLASWACQEYYCINHPFCHNAFSRYTLYSRKIPSIHRPVRKEDVLTLAILYHWFYVGIDDKAIIAKQAHHEYETIHCVRYVYISAICDKIKHVDSQMQEQARWMVVVAWFLSFDNDTAKCLL